jgi:hypothetical protein
MKFYEIPKIYYSIFLLKMKLLQPPGFGFLKIKPIFV